MTATNNSVKGTFGTFGSFRDFAAEAVVGDESVQIYALSLSAGSSDSGEDCHAVSAMIDGCEHDLGEVSDALTSDEMNAEIARRVAAIV